MKKVKVTRKANKAKKSKKANAYQSFSLLMETSSHLKSLRREYADVPARVRRMAAEREYGEAVVNDLFNLFMLAMGKRRVTASYWSAGFRALAIDPTYAWALTTVGGLEYLHGFTNEAMELFLTLTTLPEDEEDLHEIIDKSADFLLDQEDFQNALRLYLAAESAFPKVADYPCGSGYCYYCLGNIEEMVRKARKAAVLEPQNHVYLNDLGFSLLEAGFLDEAEVWLRKAVDLSPDYELACENLETLAERRQQLGQSCA